MTSLGDVSAVLVSSLTSQEGVGVIMSFSSEMFLIDSDIGVICYGFK